MAKSYFRVSEFKQEVLDSKSQTFESGCDIGFHSAKHLFSMKKGFTSYWYAAPFSGKTSLLLDIYIHIAKKYGEIIAIYSPEAGGRSFLTSYIVQVYLGKKLHGANAQEASIEEWEEALSFIDKHFIILSPKVVGVDKTDFTTEEMFKQIYEAEKEYGIKVGFLCIDPHTMLRKNEVDRKKTISDYILDNLYYINHVADSMNMHITIAMHTASENTVIDPHTGIEYLPKPFPSRLANGANVFRTGQSMIGLFRTPAGVLDKVNDAPYPENCTEVLIQKQKVLGAGETGSFRLFYDVEKQKFYEIIANVRYYCGQYENIGTPTTSQLKPSRKFDDDLF